MQTNTVEQTDGKNRNKLLNFIKNKVASSTDAEDILQDVFYQFYNTIRSEEIEKITSWLYQAAGNKIIDWYRKKKSVSLDELNEKYANHDENDEECFHLEDLLLEPAETPEEAYLRSTVWSTLADALDDLPEEQRQVFVLHELDGKSMKEISEITGTSVNTLLSRKRYAILYLREALKDLYDELIYE